MGEAVPDGVEVASTRDGVEVLLGHTCCRAAPRRPVGLRVATGRCGGVRLVLAASSMPVGCLRRRCLGSFQTLVITASTYKTLALLNFARSFYARESLLQSCDARKRRHRSRFSYVHEDVVIFHRCVP